MSSTLDPAKLKVVELRAELAKRGLETKGIKAALVKRLKDALEEELAEELPDTSIADTSTEDVDTSKTEDHPEEETKVPDKGDAGDEEAPLEQEESNDKSAEVAPPMEVEASEPVPTEEPLAKSKPIEDKTSETVANNVVPESNGDQVAETEDADAVETGDEKKSSEEQPKGEKRKHSPSPDRSQRRRSKSPVKEDEPPIDNTKVQLSWYDSDLHLQLDKESFLSAKPYHDGAFGYAWAGVRATHGVNSGKACFEVKITEELKWEDFSKYYEKHRRDHRSPKKPEPDRKKNDEDKDEPTTKEENDGAGEKTENDAEDKPEEKVEGENTESETKADEPMETDENKEQAESVSEDNADEVKKEDESAKESDKEKEAEPEKEKEAEADKENEAKPEKEEEVEPIPTHLFRVGWSLLSTGLQLGEDKFSYGYESSGKFVTEKTFVDYGVKFGVGDVIGSFLSIDEDDVTITYTVNGEVQPVATTVPKSELPEDFALFPHVLSRNYSFEFNLGSREEVWFSNPDELSDYEFLDKIEDKIAGPFRPETRNECEVILMCGLPASGKTHWVQEYIAANPDKKYTLLGNTHLLEKMTVSGDALKSKFKGSWNTLLDKLQKCLNKLCEVAALRRRNYIIDQTNVFPSAQRRKMRSFEGFKRRAVVVVVGDEEQAKRQSLQEAKDGKDVPDSAVLEMKANMSLPQKGEWLDEVVYAEANEEDAKTLVQKYNTQGREAGYGIQRRFGHRDDRRRWQNRRNDYQGGNYRDRNYHNRYDRGPPRQNWHSPRPAGMWRDRRDNRGPPMGGGSRDWRNNRGNGGRDRGNRDNQGSNYNRNRNQPNRNSSGSWQSGGNWGGQGGWGNQPWAQGTWSQGGWGGQNQNQWKYGGGSGQGYGGYSNWNYYGQYPQNWGGAQGQTNTGAATNQYGQYSQQDWAQYAQQYAQQGQTTTTQSAPQK